MDKPRCTGHCCRNFALEEPYDEVLEDYARWQKNPALSRIPDIQTLAPMLIPLPKLRGAEIFTCKNLKKNGDCGIYETRPKMCRDFPGEAPCPFAICASHGPKNPIQKLVAWIRT